MNPIHDIRVEDYAEESWLTWKETTMGGIADEWKQRRLTRRERLLWRLFKRTPKP